MKLRGLKTQRRETRERGVPKVPLGDQHMRNCQLLLNRRALLPRLKQNAIVAELGVANGTFSTKVLELAKPRRLHLIDAWGNDRYHEGLFSQVSAKFSAEVEDGSVVIHRDLSTRAVDLFADDYFDWIYIDTDHSYRTTREELVRYAPKVKQEGVISGHDYAMGDWVRSFRYGVIEAVHEFCVDHDWEFIYLTFEPTEKQSFAIRRIQRN
jgi:hypothetical protein